MDNPTAEDGSKRPVTADDATDGSPTLTAEIVEPRDQPAECTIFPLDGSDTQLVTQWITAKEGAFVSLEERR
ncbi:DUF7511 domain-containing protein [Halosimplex amylolyticum]|uniref:DUF7511 domain-containing protein n=1 Tax=Halosimplex amylolyticum TaxID=3396616 RepID=UPI003F54C6BE